MKKALITGANKGLGFETARHLLQQGYYVYLGCRNKQHGEDALKKLSEQGLTQAEVLELDVTSAASVKSARKKTAALDVLVNNAGILGKLPSAGNPVTVDDVKQVFETNFFGAIRVTEAFIDLIKQALQGRIVNVTSDLGSLTLHNDPSWEYYPYKGLAYGPSKTALNAYTLALAFQLKDTPVKVNCVTPGHTATDFNNYRGHKKPEDSCKIITYYATLDETGPSGKFFGENGELPW